LIFTFSVKLRKQRLATLKYFVSASVIESNLGHGVGVEGEGRGTSGKTIFPIRDGIWQAASLTRPGGHRRSSDNAEPANLRLTTERADWRAASLLLAERLLSQTIWKKLP
jgi:hypothetical protein